MLVKKIACIGTHSAGKTTFCFKLAHKYKMQGYNVDFVQERIRYSPFPINNKMTIDTALWIYHQQICRELESISRGFQIIISDRTPLDTFIYAIHFKLRNQMLLKCRDAAAEWLKTYHEIYFIKPDIEIVKDGIRSEDENFRKNVDKLFCNFMNHYKDVKPENQIIHTVNTTLLKD